jgi:hypothetical protein
MNDLILLIIITIQVFLNSALLILVFLGAIGISSFLYYHWRGLNYGDAITAGSMAILMFAGLIISSAGAIFVGDPQSFVVSNSTTETQIQLLNKIMSNGWGLVGFGIAILSISYGYFGNIENQRNVTMIRVFLFRGRRHTRAFQEFLTSSQIIAISLIWLSGSLLILLHNLFFNPWQSTQNPFFVLIPSAVAVIMAVIGFSCMVFGLYRNQIIRQTLIKRGIAVFRWIRRQFIRYCIFCYLFPNRFPEIFEN